MFDYFYGAQAEQFAFYRVPKVLFTNDRFKYLSAEAKTLYGILLDRVSLSAKNGWIDEKRIVLENMLCLKRAGADRIITYHALDIAKWI